MITFPGMADFIVDVSLKDTGIVNIGKVAMTSRFHLLQEVIVQSGKAIRMRGDTLEFRADSFPVAAGANVEELLRRLPGIEIGKDGKIKAQGQDVTKVLVDGDEFFGDDPTLATQYLQAKSIDKVQVFDKKSDQATFSGIDDGIRTKTINLKLKENAKNGLFGKLSGGTDAKDFYTGEAMMNVFRGREKISAFAITSNTGTTGLSSQDSRQYLTSNNDYAEDETGRYIGNNLDNSDRYYGSGLPTSLYTGAQYANKWNQNKRNINFNYRLNRLTTEGWQTGSSTQLLPDSSLRASRNNSTNSSYSLQHRAGGYYDITLDSFSIMKVTVQGQQQNSTSLNESYYESKDGHGNFLNKSNQLTQTEGTSGYLNSSLSWQRRFRKKGRNISVLLSQNYNTSTSTRRTESLSFYYTGTAAAPGDSVNQQQLNKNITSSVAARITYTEPLAKNLYLSGEFSSRHTGSDKDRNVMAKTLGGKYDAPIDSLSNNYTYNIITQMPGLTLQYNPDKFTFSAGSKIGYTTLQQINRDTRNDNSRHFVNLFPQAQASYSITQTKRLNLSYNGRTDQPTIEQLQPLRDNSNPLYITIGNPGLRPSFNHRFGFSYFSFSMIGRGASVNAGINWSQTFNSIITSQSIDQFNKSVTQYVNRDGLPGINGYISFSRSMSVLNKKGTINLGANLSVNNSGYLRILNNVEIRTRQSSFNGGPSISFYKAKAFNLNYNAYFSYSESNSNVENIGSTYNWSHSHNINTTIYLPWQMELTSDANMNFQPANSSFSTSRQIIKWNASMVKKFGKNALTQLRFSIYDILNNSNGYSRYASGGSFSETSTNYIPRYALLTFTWNFTRTL